MVMRLVWRTRPSPPHLSQGVKLCPVPSHLGQVVTCWNVPSGVCTTLTDWPEPPHCGHTLFVVPACTPVPSHACAQHTRAPAPRGRWLRGSHLHLLARDTGGNQA